MDWLKFAWVKRGRRRSATLAIFNETTVPLTINEVHVRTKIAISQASTTISELEEMGLIECLNASDKIGKLYRITPEGKEIISKLDEK